MNIGMIGLGKLGLPVALAIEKCGHTIYGYDQSISIVDAIHDRKWPHKEENVNEYLKDTNITVTIEPFLLDKCELVFLAVQTPHGKEYEGITRIPDERKDFDYSYLKEAVDNVAYYCKAIKKHITLVIISTVLPGTIDREIKPILNEYTHLVYNPFFIAMGTVMRDFMNPEFVLLGCEEKEHLDKVCEFYESIHHKNTNQYKCRIIEAELIKVSYNTYISSKIAIANTIGEICHKIGADPSVVMGALKLAKDRLVSTRYMESGMGDGGACHPRDNIAMSWLARRLGLSYDWFEATMIQREKHAEWQASVIREAYEETRLPVFILGYAFKPGTNITTGSPAVLVSNLLGIPHEKYDPHIDKGEAPDGVGIYFIGCAHPEFKDWVFHKNSVVIDFTGVTRKD